MQLHSFHVRCSYSAWMSPLSFRTYRVRSDAQIFNRKGDLLFYKACAITTITDCILPFSCCTRACGPACCLAEVTAQLAGHPTSPHLLLAQEWGRPKRSEKQTAEDHKLMFGFLFSLKQLVQKLAPRGASGGFHTCSTSTYKLNYFETPSGFRFVLCTDLRSGAPRRSTCTPLPLHALPRAATIPRPG